MEMFHVENPNSKKASFGKEVFLSAILMSTGNALGDIDRKNIEHVEGSWNNAIEAVSDSVILSDREYGGLFQIQGDTVEVISESIPHESHVVYRDDQEDWNRIRSEHAEQEHFCDIHTHPIVNYYPVEDVEKLRQEKGSLNIPIIPKPPSRPDIVRQSNWKKQLPEVNVTFAVVTYGGMYYYEQSDFGDLTEEDFLSESGARLFRIKKRYRELFKNLYDYKKNGNSPTENWLRDLSLEDELYFRKIGLVGESEISSDLQEFLKFRDILDKVDEQKEKLFESGFLAFKASVTSGKDVQESFNNMIDVYKLFAQASLRFVPEKFISQEPPCAGVDYDAQYEFRDGQWQQIP